MSNVDPAPVPTPTGRGEATSLAILAAILLLVEGAYLVGVGGVTLLFASVPLVAGGGLSIAGGAALLTLAFAYRAWPEARSYTGLLVVVISAGALWFGGGFLVGTTLGLVSGVLMIVLPIYRDR